jgi:stage II sporulation protein M
MIEANTSFSESFKRERILFSELKVEFLFMSTLFVMSAIGGYLYGIKNPEIYQQMAEILQSIFSMDLTIVQGSYIFIIVLINNVVKTFLTVVLGITVLFPLIFIIGNGVVLGVFLAGASADHSLLFVAFSILPHGIIEIPTAVYAASLGLHAGLLKIRKKDEYALKRAFTSYKSIILPLIFIAAIIEAFITPVIMSLVYNP